MINNELFQEIILNRDINVGVDIESIDRFKSLKMDENSNFLKNIFSDSELEYCYSKPLPAQHLAARFAAKEAVIKAMFGFSESLSPKEIEIVNDDKGMPNVLIRNELSEKIKIFLSLSHCENKAIAFVIGVKNV